MIVTGKPIRYRMPSTFRGIGIVGVLFVAIVVTGLRQPERMAMVPRRQLLIATDRFADAVRLLQRTPLDEGHAQLLRERFRTARLAYKRIEWAAEYFDPLTARSLNGPPVPEAELNGTVIQPEGLQVIETMLFPKFQYSQKRQLTQAIKILALNAAAFKETFNKVDLQDWQILDAAKLEIFRIATLGLNDFDDPLLKNCFSESANALQGVAVVIRNYSQEIDLNPAISYLAKNQNFDGFDRAAFIIAFANPLTQELTVLHSRLKLPDVRYNRLLRQDAPTLFAVNAFNRNAFTASPEDSATTEKITLGKRLFFDPVLSGNGKRSCASCHQPERAFTDGLAKNLDLAGKKQLARNTPTLLNTALQPAQFYDLRAASLEDQANDVLRNADEMHGDMKIATGHLWRNDYYRKLFEQAYPIKQRKAIDTSEIINALASYVRSLTRLNSRFDYYMRGDRQAVSPLEREGFNLFMGKAKCSTCHYLPLFNGALPPRYLQMEAEVIGVPAYPGGKRIDSDLGTAGIQPLTFNAHAFKTTTVRNAARTAPYMHNGVFKTLAEVIDFYNAGGGLGNGIQLKNQTLAPEPLRLTKKEKAALICFIESLDSHD